MALVSLYAGAVQHTIPFLDCVSGPPARGDRAFAIPLMHLGSPWRTRRPSQVPWDPSAAVAYPGVVQARRDETSPLLLQSFYANSALLQRLAHQSRVLSGAGIVPVQTEGLHGHAPPTKIESLRGKLDSVRSYLLR